MNTVALIGKLGRAFFHAGSNPRITFFTEVEGGGKYPDRIKCVAWGGNANKVKALNEGDLLLVAGRLQVRRYEKNEERHYSTEVVALSVRALGSFVEEEAPKRELSPAPALGGNGADPGVSEDDIPW